MLFQTSPKSKIHPPHYLTYILLLTVSIGAGIASGGNYPIDDLVQSNDSAVIGRLCNVSDYAKWGHVEAKGHIQVDEVLFGTAKIGDRIPVKWDFYPGTWSARLSRDPSAAIWLLSGKPTGFTFSPHYSRLELSEKDKVIKASENPIRVEQVIEPGVPDYTIRLIYRNVTSQTMELPSLEYDGGKLHIPESTTFSATAWPPGGRLRDEVELYPAMESLVYISHPTTITLTPGKTYGIEFPFQSLYPATSIHVPQPHWYFFTWEIPGFGRSNLITIRPPADFKPNAKPDGGCISSPWLSNVYILLRYSPTREILIALCIGIPSLFWFLIVRYRRRQLRLKNCAATP